MNTNKLIKRGQKKQNESLINEVKFGENEVDFNTFEFIGVRQQKGTLSEKEAKLLKLLVDKKNQVVSRDLILQLVWGVDVYPSTRTIDNYLLNFRKYFEENPKSPRYFHSVRGVGYKYKEL